MFLSADWNPSVPVLDSGVGIPEFCSNTNTCFLLTDVLLGAINMQPPSPLYQERLIEGHNLHAFRRVNEGVCVLIALIFPLRLEFREGKLSPPLCSCFQHLSGERCQLVDHSPWLLLAPEII